MAWVSVHEQIRDHRKTRDLMRRLGCSRQEAVGLLVMLWTWGINNADEFGNLTDTTADDIVDGCMARGELAGKAVSALTGSGWIDRLGENHYVLHDWDVWQEAWFKAIDRREQSKMLMRELRNKKRDVSKPLAQPLADCEHNVSTSPSPNRHLTVTLPSDNLERSSDDERVEPPSDSTPTKTPKIPPTPYQKIVEAFHRICKSFPQVTQMPKSRKGHIKARWAEHPDMATWEKAFTAMQESDFLRGDKKDWRADFDWLVKSGMNMAKVLEGNYVNREPLKPPDPPKPSTSKYAEGWGVKQ